MQHFAEIAARAGPRDALATAEDHGITAEHAAEAPARRASTASGSRRSARPAPRRRRTSGAAPTAEEAERLRQLEMVRQRAADRPSRERSGDATAANRLNRMI